MPDELQEHLNALARDDCYRVESVLRESAFETTQLVYFVGRNGAEQGPFVRKYLDSGLGGAYERIMAAQRAGRRFLHLPQVIDCYEVGDQRAVILEYVPGETLADVVYRCDPSVTLACDVVTRLCDAVRELHESFDPPIIHRDLKPSNIVLTAENLTIIDLGIARTLRADAAEDTRRFGTRAYAPPEQFGFGQTDERSDVYAIGMLLYFCLTERTPDATVRRDGFRASGVPEPLRQVIEQATAIDPLHRYPSVHELRNALCAAARTCMAAGASMKSSEGGVKGKGRLLCRGRVPTGNRLPRLLARVPFGVGIAWDLVLLGWIGVLTAACAVSTVDPPQDPYRVASIPVRIVSYAGAWLIMSAPVMVLYDRRPILRIIPRAGGQPWHRRLIVAAAGALLGVAAIVIAGQFLP